MKVTDAQISLETGDTQIDVFVSKIEDEYILEVVTTVGWQSPDQAHRTEFRGTAEECFDEMVKYLYAVKPTGVGNEQQGQ